MLVVLTHTILDGYIKKWSVKSTDRTHPSNGATAQIGHWPPLLRFHNNNVLRCEFVSLTTNNR
jgi:hypothetical protein